MREPTVTRRVPPAGLRGLPPAFWWIWVSILVNWIGGFAGPMLVLSLTVGRDYSASYAGIVMSLIGLGGVAGSALGGVLADRLGRRWTMFAAHCWTAVSMAMLGLCEGRWAVALAAVAVGVGSTAVRPALQASLSDLVPAPDRQRAFALNYWALNAGGALSGVLAGLMYSHGYAVLFVADAAATLLCALVVLIKVPETRPDPAAGADTGRKALPAAVHRDRPFLLFVLMTLLFAVVFKQGSTTLPVVMTEQGHSPGTYSLVFALNGLLVVALQIPVTRLAGRQSPAGVLLAAGLLLGWGFGLTMLADSAVAFALTVAVWTAGEILQAPAGMAVAANRAPTHQRGRYQGTYGMAWTAAAFLAPAGGGWVLDRFGATTLWSLCALGGTAAGIGCLLIVGRHRSFRAAADAAVRDGSTEPLSPSSPELGRGTATERKPS
ncbi:MFS transporter [Streptomyces sp. NPDC051219]|uniref:MDR family MFS transporter n=1 Tax=Streptomyces sp. NPDC051219 TaxID=3155283 RepID=UPI0034244450